MQADRRTIVVPILLITLGLGWLLSTLGVAPQVNWIWTLGLAIVGVMTFALYGFDKVTLAVGSFFIVASLLSVLRQTGRLALDVEMPILVILAGALLLACRHPRVPAPRWLNDDKQ